MCCLANGQYAKGEIINSTIIRYALRYEATDSISSGHLYIVRVLGIDDKARREIIIKLAERGINTNVHYKPLPMMTAYKGMVTKK